MPSCAFCQNALSLPHSPGTDPDIVACMTCLNPNFVVDDGGTVKSTPVTGAGDMRQAAPPDSIGGHTLAVMREIVDDLPPLPEISLRVMEVMNDPESGVNDMANVVQEDAIISGSVLKAANSAMYGGLSEITDVPSACSRLGMRTVANLAQTVATRKLYEIGDTSLGDMISKIGRHSIAVAYCGHDIATHTAQPQPEVCFVSGLLHDIGKIGIIAAVSRADSGPATTLQTQQELLNEVIEGYHCIAGLLVAQSWNLPLKFGTIIYAHHQPEITKVDARLSAAHVVNLADLVAHVSGFPSNITREDSPLGSASCNYVGLSDIQLATLRVDLEDRLAPFFEAAAV